MHTSSFQGENCVYQAQWEAHGQTCMCIYRGWASLMSYISLGKVPFHTNKWSPSSVGLKETCIQASETCLTVSLNEDNLSGKEWWWWGCSVLSQAQQQLQGGYSWVCGQTVGLETMLWCLSLCAGSQVSFLVSAVLQTQLREHLLHGCFPSSSLQTSKNPSQKSHQQTLSSRSHPFPHHSAPSYFHVYIGGSKKTGEVTKPMNIQCSEQVYL